ncbi:MAG: DUF262 domain-containing protein [Treponema sp.]|nr:DUF262 domain-containing protein [Treponema sp.]
MKGKVYYGEYSIGHWLDLLVSGNLKLPDYQRRFVWEKDQVLKFIKSINNNEFIPPVTLGYYDNNTNYILDGQQRLTSLLLAYLSIYPKKEAFKEIENYNLFEDDTSLDDFDDEVEQKVIDWQFNILTEKDISKEDLRTSMQGNPSYEAMATDISKNLDTVYLGFSYIIPDSSENKNICYCSIFRNINMTGTALLVQESRRALYFLDNNKRPLFDNNYLGKFTIKNSQKTLGVDFIRYLALGSQFHKDGNFDSLMKGYEKKQKNEEYYLEYITESIDESKSNIFPKFSDIFKEGDFKTQLDHLKILVEAINYKIEYKSIIEVDLVFFGLIYCTFIDNKFLDISKQGDLLQDIDSAFNEINKNASHKKRPNQLSFLRERLQKSLNIYHKYIK